MIIVTGGAGFIGSNLIHSLNQRGYRDILVVDDLTEGHKFKNLVDSEINDYVDKEDFLAAIKNRQQYCQGIEAVFHLGACSATTEWNGQFMMKNNYQYSKELFHYALERHIPFLYASSAAVYGATQIFTEDLENEKPLNVYGYSKFLFDHYVRRLMPFAKSQVVGFRYFNVYGPREEHKGSMSSVAFHFNQQIQTQGTCRLFQGTDDYLDGEQKRDFVFVEDVADVNIWFYEQRAASGIYNVGTGRAQTFNDVAKAVIAWHGHGNIEYVPFPTHLQGSYQNFTQASLARLRETGYQRTFLTVEEGVKKYLDLLKRGQNNFDN